MSSTSICWSGLVLLVAGHLGAAFDPNEKSWTYTLQTVSFQSSDENVSNAEVKIDRLGRGEFGLSGYLTFGVDVPQDFEVEVLCYRSTDSGANYKLQPYTLPRQGFFQALNSFYKDMVMPSAANCSNLPQFEDALSELPAQKFVFDKCQVTTDGFPKHLPDGLYKLVFLSYGMVDIVFEAIVQVDPKSI